MQKQDITKTGNQHSTLLDQMMKTAANVEKAKEQTPFKDFVIRIAKEKKPSLKEVLAQFMEDPKPMPEIPGEPPVGESPEDALLREEGPADTTDARSAWANLGVALCGGVEEAHACLDEMAGPGEETIEEPGGDIMETQPAEMPAPMDAAPMDEAPMPMV